MIKMQLKQDKWERQVGIAHSQMKSFAKNFHTFEDNLTDTIRRYEAWLLLHDRKPLKPLDSYEKIIL